MLVRNLKLRIRQYLCFFFPNKYLLKKDEEKVQLGDLNISSKVKSTQVVRERGDVYVIKLVTMKQTWACQFKFQLAMNFPIHLSQESFLFSFLKLSAKLTIPLPTDNLTRIDNSCSHLGNDFCFVFSTVNVLFFFFFFIICVLYN